MLELTDGVDVKPLWQQVANIVRRSIQTGRLRPGDRVVEAQLATQLGISRNPIREGLRQLQLQGILEYKPNVGNVVISLSQSDVRFAIEERAHLEVQAVRLIMQSEDIDGTLGKLVKIVENMRLAEEANELDEAELLDEEFHSMLIAASGSKVLACIWKAVDPYTWMSMAWQEYGNGQPPIVASLAENHVRLLDILRSGDVTAAEQTVYSHIMESGHLFF
ncbi:MAG: GntR family transcriptional regulator [Armatimonadota bacterium]